MKKIILWILGVSLICLGIGLTITFHGGRYTAEEKNIDISKTVAIDNAKTVNITTSSADIIVAPSDDNKISLRYFGTMRLNNKTEPNVEINKVGSDLNIKTGMPQNSFYTVLTGFKLEVKVPASYSENINIKSDAGDIEINSVALNKIAVNTSSGNVNLTNCKSEEQVTSTSGDVKISDNTLVNNREITSSSGDVNLFLPQDSGFGLVFNTNSGVISDLFGTQIKQNTGKNIVATAGDGKFSISIKTKSGNLNINKN